MQTKQEKGIARVLQDFFQTEAAGGVVMVLAAIFALIFANSSALSDFYKHLIYAPTTIEFFNLSLSLPFKKFVKDVFMVVFFLIVGLELKREMTEGFLSQKGQKILPGLAALGGIVAPALIYYCVTLPYPELKAGWAIPTATDIAFAIGVLAIVGRHMPSSIRVFLLAIAIYDDLAAIIIVALFYGNGFDITYIPYIGAILFILFSMNRMNITYLTPYFICCMLLSIFIYKTGLHSTIGGVVTAMFIPMRNNKQNSQSPIGTAIHYLHPWVSYCILPLFAFVSSGVIFKGMTIEHFLSPLPFAIAAALFIGKQIGIFGMTFLTVKLRISGRPDGASWLDIYAISILAGIGFTMSLFIGLLAFSDQLLQSEAKMGVVLGSLLSTIWSIIIFKIIKKKQEKHQEASTI